MFATLKARLTVFACAVWIFGAAVFVSDPASPSGFAGGYVVALILGWSALYASIYGAFWVVEGGNGPAIAMPSKLPKWAAYTLIVIMAILIMGLPKAIFG